MRGQAGQCSNCGAIVQVPAALPAAARQPTGDPRAATAHAHSAKAQPAAATPAEQNSPNWAIIGVAGGAAAIVLVVFAILVINGTGGDSVAQAPSDPPVAAPAPPAPSTSSPPTAPRQSPTTTIVAPYSPPASSPSSASGPSSLPSSTFANVSPDDDPFRSSASDTPEEIADSPDFGKPASTRPTLGRSADHNIANLPPALMAWHGQRNTKLAGLNGAGDPENPVTHLSWMSHLLPHLGYQREYSRRRLDKDVTDGINLSVGHTVVPEFLNPLDSRKTWDGYPFDGMGLTHFVGMSGIEDKRNACAAQLPRSDPRAGIFGYDAVATEQEITDGKANTIMIVGSGQLASPWLLGGGATIRGAREPHIGGISGLGTKGMPSAGTLALMADGSVRFVPQSVDAKVFRALCTIHGSESVDLETAAPHLPIETLK
jgi:hypothetical protein